MVALTEEKEEKKVKGDLMEKKSASLGHGVHGEKEKESCKNAEVTAIGFESQLMDDEAMVLMTELGAQQWSDGNSLSRRKRERKEPHHKE